VDQIVKGEGKAAASRARIIDAAAELFAARGFDGVSIRDIAKAVSMTTASLYYHFASKEELFVAVHGHSMAIVTRAVREAADNVVDPWDRIEAAAGAHCAALLDSSGNRAILSVVAEGGLARVHDALVAQRDAYERLLQTIIDAAPMRPGVDRKLLRLQLLGGLNFMPTWYREGGPLSAEAIGRTMVHNLRIGIEPRAAPGKPP
jgi:AcrR family transcriptional regulator